MRFLIHVDRIGTTTSVEQKGSYPHEQVRRSASLDGLPYQCNGLANSDLVGYFGMNKSSTTRGFLDQNLVLGSGFEPYRHIEIQKQALGGLLSSLVRSESRVAFRRHYAITACPPASCIPSNPSQSTTSGEKPHWAYPKQTYPNQNSADRPLFILAISLQSSSYTSICLPTSAPSSSTLPQDLTSKGESEFFLYFGSIFRSHLMNMTLWSVFPRSD